MPVQIPYRQVILCCYRSLLLAWYVIIPTVPTTAMSLKAGGKGVVISASTMPDGKPVARDPQRSIDKMPQLIVSGQFRHLAAKGKGIQSAYPFCQFRSIFRRGQEECLPPQKLVFRLFGGEYTAPDLVQSTRQYQSDRHTAKHPSLGSAQLSTGCRSESPRDTAQRYTSTQTEA